MAYNKRSVSDVDSSLSIVVVNYNTRDMTLACIESVYRETKSPFELIVVDNASHDGSAEAIAARFPQVRLLVSDTNLGFAKAHDIAVPQATGEYLLLLNPDTIVLNHAIDKLMAFANRNPESEIWGGRTVFEDGSLNPYSCWRRQSLWTLFCAATGLSSILPNSSVFNAEAYGGWKRDKERNVDIVTGCLLLMRRQFWNRLGGFDPLFFMYGEEADLCLRARELGARPRMTPTAEIVHYGGVSETVRSDKMVRLLNAKMALIDRHFGVVSKPIGRTLLRAWPWSRMFAYRLLTLGSSNSSRTRRAEEWAETWEKRRQWWSGYSRGAK